MESVPTSVINPEGLRSKSPGRLLRISAPTFCLRSGKRALKGSQEVHDPGFRDGRRRKRTERSLRVVLRLLLRSRVYYSPSRYAPGSAKSALSLCSPQRNCCKLSFSAVLSLSGLRNGCRGKLEWKGEKYGKENFDFL